MATQPTIAGTPNPPGTNTTTCTAAENADNDHFYCIGKTGVGAGTDLQNIFKAAAAQLAAGGSHLLQLYPSPSVSSLSPSSGLAACNTTVVINGNYFTGATQVNWGGTTILSTATAPSPRFTVNSDTQITVSSCPPGTAGKTVDVTVTTPGDVSPNTPADNYTYN
jgi:hypothetical protein